MESLDGLLTIVVILLILFLIGRELICWYFKLNHLLFTLRRIEIQLKRLNQDKLTAEDLKLLTELQRQALSADHKEKPQWNR